MGHAPYLSRLTLSNFRNYSALTLDLDHRPVVLTGDNGAGKTNLLEAISFLSPGRGLRRAGADQIANVHGDGSWALSVTLTQDDVETRIGTGLQLSPDGTERTRKLRINQAPATSSDVLLDYARILWLTPAMDGLFTGPAGDRRRFLDRLVLASDPAHGKRVSAFEKALSARNKLLDDPRRDDGWLNSLEIQVAELAVSVALARRELVTRLRHRIEAAPKPESAAFPSAMLSLTGTFEDLIGPELRPAVDIEEDYRKQLMQNRRRDAAAGRTLEGPHRSDLQVLHLEKNMPASLASTGEQKALLIGLVLAHAALVQELDGRSPILLLDEIAAHLDPQRRACLFDTLLALGGQAWMTGTDPMLFDALGDKAQHFTVADGALLPI
ncbi:MAG: DNA replication/repair protein RecF [Hyphomicrobiales bacterium]|nr:MAG: DNA replication/repair protein RecF [Hyphomicrobiales bacterium]